MQSHIQTDGAFSNAPTGPTVIRSVRSGSYNPQPFSEHGVPREFSQILHLYEKHFTSRDLGWDCPGCYLTKVASRCSQLNSSDGPFGLFEKEAHISNVSYAEFGILQAIVRSVPIPNGTTPAVYCRCPCRLSRTISDDDSLRRVESAHSRCAPLLLWYRSVGKER